MIGYLMKYTPLRVHHDRVGITVPSMMPHFPSFLGRQKSKSHKRRVSAVRPNVLT
jgi:hypothetical protein